jgi:hypothetical protein
MRGNFEAAQTYEGCQTMQISEEMIRLKAYELWEANGKPQGQAERHWFAAKALLQDAANDNLPSARNQSPPIGLRQLNPS